ncbi:MAG: methyltransferase [Alphaproteobacteria bacterium]|nr:methyltransferase [Alphaproteobacteria bacterium]MBU1527364.1 methyltransferase [Alphaproteobacteria bacterium]MBU2116543.1 methyltransferase [Alphaproteobacteria bacterium]MBU2352364.1 methyltransferase [Alphaproteobacteria bacterium]MBU2382901.1 methyltransferase [Alphaproteobacteria bacterium]
MTVLLYGRPPAVFDPPSDALQTSPLIPGAAALEDVPPGSADLAVIYAPPGALERRAVLAHALRALKPGGRLDAMAPKDKGGSRLKKELEGFGLSVMDEPKAHHRRCRAAVDGPLTGLEQAIEAGAARRVPDTGLWSRPGVFAWDRIDAGTATLALQLPPMKGAGADLGCGVGVLSLAVLTSEAVTALSGIDLDRRAVEAARLNVTDPRAGFAQADARTLAAAGDLDFVVMNPPFHDGGQEDRRLGQAFVRKAAELLRKNGALWMVANRHLPYEADLNAAFRRVRVVDESAGYKIFEALK